MSEASKVQQTALTITKWVGSPASIITHTVLFIASFGAALLGYLPWDEMLLVVTTIVSLEAIYLSIFIQMSINYTTQELAEVGEDIEEIQEDIGEIQEDVDEIQEDVDELQEDVEDISEDVEEMTEEEEEDNRVEAEQKKTLSDIQSDLRKLMQDIEKLQNK
jgi:methyl-accepting chemotaxis protein